jgi:hypothetical protein
MRLQNGKMEKLEIPILQLQDWDSSCDFAINAPSKCENGKMENPNLAAARSGSKW